MRVAQILNGKAHWIFETDEMMDDLKSRFAADIVFVEVNDDIQEGWDWDGEKAIPPPHIDPMPEIRMRRNQLLTACDWTQLPDVVLTTEQKATWVEYRQQLRDFPETCDPDNPIWPVLPLI